VLYGRKPRRSTVPLALEAAQKAVLCDEHDAWAHFALGWAFSMSRSPEAGIEEYRKALAINPYLPHIQCCLAAALSDVGQIEKALAELSEVERLVAPEVYPGQCNSIHALIYFLSEKRDEAIKAAQRSVWQYIRSSPPCRELCPSGEDGRSARSIGNVSSFGAEYLTERNR
jgi:tetratricopeptide (TPR) repeat protein